MIDSKKKFMIIGVISLLLFVTVIAVAVLAPKKQENPKPKVDIKKKVVDKPKQVQKKKVTSRIMPVAPPLKEAPTLTDKEKKKQLKMAEKKKEYYADLFEKYGIDEEGQNAIIKSLIDARTETRDLMRSSQYRTDKSDEARLAVGEKLALVQEETNNQIREIAGEEFLNDLLKKNSDSTREKYVKRLDRSLKMSDEQKSELDALYSSTQTSFIERFTLPKDELDARKETLKNGIKDILTEEQYSKYQKSGSSRRGRRRK